MMQPLRVLVVLGGQNMQQLRHTLACMSTQDATNPERRQTLKTLSFCCTRLHVSTMVSTRSSRWCASTASTLR